MLVRLSLTRGFLIDIQPTRKIGVGVKLGSHSLRWQKNIEHERKTGNQSVKIPWKADRRNPTCKFIHRNLGSVQLKDSGSSFNPFP